MKTNPEKNDLISRFLNSQLQTPAYQLTDEDINIIRANGLAEYIYLQIVRSSFRRTAVDSETSVNIRAQIKYHLDRHDAISFSIPFGAYKNWHLWSFPEPDWAEVFNVNYMTRFAGPIAAVYEPGVTLQYSYSADVMDLVSNIPNKDTHRYISAFNRLLALFQSRISHNILLRTVRINDFYSGDEQTVELKKNYNDNKANWTKKYPEEIRRKKLASAEHNLMLNGVEDLRNLNQDQLEERFLDAAMWCDALDSLKKRREYNKGSTNIQIVYVRGPYLSLHLGACETSAFHAWAGTGVVERRDKKFLQRIISHAKLLSLQAANNLRFINVETEFQELSKNYLIAPTSDLQL